MQILDPGKRDARDRAGIGTIQDPLGVPAWPGQRVGTGAAHDLLDRPQDAGQGIRPRTQRDADRHRGRLLPDCPGGRLRAVEHEGVLASPAEEGHRRQRTGIHGRKGGRIERHPVVAGSGADADRFQRVEIAFPECPVLVVAIQDPDLLHGLRLSVDLLGFLEQADQEILVPLGGRRVRGQVQTEVGIQEKARFKRVENQCGTLRREPGPESVLRRPSRELGRQERISHCYGSDIAKGNLKEICLLTLGACNRL